MNYIKHLTHWFELLKNNDKAKPTHIALYITLFQLWNQSRFPTSFIINKPELMNLSKIGSNTTYTKCMKEMSDWQWIHYTPSFCNYGASTVVLKNWSDESVNTEIKKSKNKSFQSTPFGLATELGSDTATELGSDTGTGLASGSEVGYNNKTYKHQTDKNKNLNNFKKNYNEPM